MLFLLAVLSLTASQSAAYQDPVGPTQPWGLRIAYGASPSTSMSFIWSTRQPVEGATITATSAATGAVARAPAAPRVFTDSNNTQYIYNATLTGLEPGASYSYVVGNASELSPARSFSLAPISPAGPWGAGRDYPVLAIYGDLGVDANAKKTLPLLYADVDAGRFDVALHVGDIAYDLQSASGSSGDAFVVSIEPFASRVPNHLCPGNHESFGNLLDGDFLQYRRRFDIMPGGAEVRKAQSIFHSFNVGLLHVIMFSSEAFFDVGPFSLLLLPEMFAFVEADLAAVNRTETPWIISMAHQPMYCSRNDDNDDCHSLVSLMRDGLLGQFGFEELINRYGVEMHFGAHEHAYERNYPVFQYKWANITGPAAYVDFNATVQMISGAAGCPENTDPWVPGAANAFSAFRAADYGCE